MIAISSQVSYPLVMAAIYDAATLSHISYLIDELIPPTGWIFLI